MNLWAQILCKSNAESLFFAEMLPRFAFMGTKVTQKYQLCKYKTKIRDIFTKSFSKFWDLIVLLYQKHSHSPASSTLVMVGMRYEDFSK